MTDAAWLSSARVVKCSVKSGNSATLVFSATIKLGTLESAAGVKPEEGGDDVKSSWLLRPGLHTYYNGRSRRLRNREVKLIRKTYNSRIGTTRLHEVGLASNRRSARCGEYVPGPWHTRHTTKVVLAKYVSYFGGNIPRLRPRLG